MRETYARTCALSLPCQVLGLEPRRCPRVDDQLVTGSARLGLERYLDLIIIEEQTLEVPYHPALPFFPTLPGLLTGPDRHHLTWPSRAHCPPLLSHDINLLFFGSPMHEWGPRPVQIVATPLTLRRLESIALRAWHRLGQFCVELTHRWGNTLAAAQLASSA